jgi:hypothetical protein
MAITFGIVAAVWMALAIAVDQMLFSLSADRLPDQGEDYAEPDHDPE